MRAETLAGALGITGLLLLVAVALREPTRPPPSRGEPRAAFPPPPAPRLDLASRGGLPAVMGLDREIARIGRAAPRLEPPRRAFLDATNLTQFALDRLPDAVAGDGASQYFIYLALEQCRAYLRRDLESARLNLETLLGVSAELAGEERAAWHAEYERCRGFGLGGWDAIGIALGMEEPGSEAEYASLWFERAGQARYPTALAELALRPNPIGLEERKAMLREALARAGPDVYWLLFAHSSDDPARTGSMALAWLIVACRAGQDCTEDARWFRSMACMQGGACAGGRSALEHYWFAASAGQRQEAWTASARIEAALAASQWERLPVPDLERLDNRVFPAPE